MNDTFSIQSGRSQQQQHASHHQYSLGRNQNESYHNNDFQNTQKQKYEKIANQSGFIQSQSQQHQQNDGTILTISNQNILRNNKDIYENQIPIKIKSQEREEQSTYLTLKIFVTPGNNIHGQVLKMELTDEGNYETDFLLVKNDQNLIVDFSGFSTKLIELLELSLNSSKEDKIQFGCVFEINSNKEALFKVTETNQFKTLVHLTLKFRSATDDILKNYLADKMNKEQSENVDLRIKNSRLEEQLQEEQSKKEKLNQQLSHFQLESDQKEEQLRLESSKKLHLQKEEFLQRESELRNTYESKHQLIIEKMEKQIQDLQNQNGDLNEIKFNLESQAREYISKNKVNEKELDILNKEIQTLRLENKNLENIRFAQEKKITELSVKIESVEKQLKDKDQLINSSKNLNNNTEDQKKMLEKEIQEKNSAIDKLEKKLDQCKNEIEKGNDVIDKIRESLEKKAKKLKQKNSVIIQQEQNLQSLQSNIDSLHKQLTEIQREKDNSEMKFKETQSQNTDLKQKIEESQKVIEQNQSMIQYLNSQLNSSKPNIPLGSSNVNFGLTASNYRQNSYIGGSSNTQYNKQTTYSNNTNIEDKYSQEQPRSYTPLSYSQKTNNPLHQTNLYANTNASSTAYHFNKSPITKDFEYDVEDKGFENHTNFNNKYTTTRTGQKSGNNNSFSINRSINALDEGNIAPIKYRNPTKN